MTIKHVETLIIGGGQAGLTMSHRLSQRGRPHLVLERHRIAERWRTERWNGLRFQFPNWSVRLPDFPFPHNDPDGFTTSAAIVDFITAYAARVAAPVRCGVEVTALRRGDTSGFVAETSQGPIAASHVVVATGPYQRAVVPDLPIGDSVFQVHASRYRDPSQPPPGAVLVVGSGASGAQIAEELLRTGRRVYLCVGEHRRMPRRYRGHDLIRWLELMGLDQTPVEQRGPSAALPLITGAYGGHTIDLRRFAADGVTLLGRLRAVDDGVLHFADDLAQSLAKGDAAYGGFLDLVDAYAARAHPDSPLEPEARIGLPEPACVSAPIRSLDLSASGISTVLWSTGYGFDFSWLHLPVLNERGEPRHRHGITDVPGLYFLGLQWLSKMSSSFLSGVGDDAARLADHIAAGVAPMRTAAG
jgi:putative flavoprotein involved in K+ transport